jgi:hemolysin III
MNRIRDSLAAFPSYTLRERIADGCVHIVGVTASLVALGALLVIGVQSETTLWGVALLIYGLALVSMFFCSAGYHLITWPRLKEVFRRLDHAAIFLMIAGTYTPFVLIKMNNAWGLSLLAVVWAIAVMGVAIKLFVPRFLEGLTVALYLILYTIGVVFHLWERLPYQNAIWHGFVLSAASCHFAAVIFVVGV